MDEEFHSIVIDQSQKDSNIFQNLNIIGQKTSSSSNWILYKISVLDTDLNETIKNLQDNMSEGNWYLHFYNKDGSKLIIVFREKIFYTDNNKQNWKEAINYGESLGIPKEQLDFFPNTFIDEKY
jgi:hypothetical protein